MTTSAGVGEWLAKQESNATITAAMDVGKCPLACVIEARPASHSLLSLILFLLSAGTKGRRWELCHLTGSPGGGGHRGLSHYS